MNTSQRAIVAVIGPNGVGKEGVSRFVASRLTFQYISVSGVLAQAVQSGHTHAAMIKERQAAGLLVDDSVTCELVELSFAMNTSGGNVTDGFPRSCRQDEALIHFCALHNHRLVVVELDASDEVCITRSLTRAREGENREIITARLELYRSTAPAIISGLKCASLANPNLVRVVKCLDNTSSADVVQNKVLALIQAELE